MIAHFGRNSDDEPTTVLAHISHPPSEPTKRLLGEALAKRHGLSLILATPATLFSLHNLAFRQAEHGNSPT